MKSEKDTAKTMPILAEIRYPSDLCDTWIFDLDDRDERIDFARRADHALRQGAVVTTRKV